MSKSIADILNEMISIRHEKLIMDLLPPICEGHKPYNDAIEETIKLYQGRESYNMYTYYNDYMIDYFNNIDFSKLYAEFIELCYKKYSTDKKYLILFVFLMSISRNLNYSDNLVVDLFKTIREYIFGKLNIEYKELIYDNVVLFSVWCEYTKKEEYIGGGSRENLDSENPRGQTLVETPYGTEYSRPTATHVVEIHTEPKIYAIKGYDHVSCVRIGTFNAIIVVSKSKSIEEMKKIVRDLFISDCPKNLQVRIAKEYNTESIVSGLLKEYNGDFVAYHLYWNRDTPNINVRVSDKEHLTSLVDLVCQRVKAVQTNLSTEEIDKEIKALGKSVSQSVTGNLIRSNQSNTTRSNQSNTAITSSTSRSRINKINKIDENDAGIDEINKIDENIGHPKLSAFQVLLIIHLISQHYYNINLVSTKDINLQKINEMTFYELPPVNNKKYRLNLNYFFIKKIYGRNTFVQFLFVDVYRIMYKAYLRLFTTAMFIMMTNVNRKNEITESEKNKINEILNKNKVSNHDKDKISKIISKNEISDSDKIIINKILNKNKIPDSDKDKINKILNKNEIADSDKDKISNIISKNVINFILNQGKIDNEDKKYLLYKLCLRDIKEAKFNTTDVKKLSDAINWDLLCEYIMNDDDFD